MVGLPSGEQSGCLSCDPGGAAVGVGDEGGEKVGTLVVSDLRPGPEFSRRCGRGFLFVESGEEGVLRCEQFGWCRLGWGASQIRVAPGTGFPGFEVGLRRDGDSFSTAVRGSGMSEPGS